MLDADYLGKIADGATRLAEDLYDGIIACVVERVTQRLANGEKYVLTATDKWQIETLTEAGYLKADIMKEIAKRTPLATAVIKKAFEDAGIEQISYDMGMYESVGITADTALSPNIIRILQRGYETTLGTWNNITRTTADVAQQTFITACNTAHNMVATGAKSLSQAYFEALDTVSNDGTYVTYPSGHRDTIETAIPRAVRTGVAQTCGHITAQRAKENGVQLFLTSAHAGARPDHQVWQGKIFWVDWDELARRIGISADGATQATDEQRAKYPEFCKSTDIGTVTGLEGANCRHSYGAYFEGTPNPYENMTFADTYAIEQKARGMERRIRKTKADLRDLEKAKGIATDQQIKDDLQKRIDKRLATAKRQTGDYYSYCNSNNLKPMEMRLKISN